MNMEVFNRHKTILFFVFARFLKGGATKKYRIMIKKFIYFLFGL
jgi:hypothetical protein